MRKAQIQLGETVFVVFIILIILVFGLVFYSKTQEVSIQEKGKQAHAERTITLGHTLSRWPELECSILDATDFDCLDRKKLDVLSSFLSQAKEGYEYNYYREQLGTSRIIVFEIYPGNSQWLLYNNTYLQKGAETVYVPVNLLDPVTNTFSLGMMELTVYG